MLRQADHLGVLHPLHHRQHGVGPAQLLAKQDQLVLDEELRLRRDRRHLGVGRVAVFAMARGAELEPLLSMYRENKKGDEPGPSPHDAEKHYFFGAAGAA
jgi:hypothetical protein